MLEPHTVDQILRVLELFRQNKRLGFSTGSACSRAIKQVAEEHNVAYQTIGDGCRRRLGLIDIGVFHGMAEAWLNGDADALVKVLKRNSTKSSEPRIDAFFATPPEAKSSAHKSGNGAKQPTATLHLHMSDPDLKMLRALAQLQDQTVADCARDLLSSSARDRLRSALA